jgi:ribosomal protein S18 acetylase RimI-like enzyme
MEHDGTTHEGLERIGIQTVGRDDFAAVEASLAEIVADGVNGGAAISFMQPYSHADGLRFWRDKVFPDVARGGRVLFVAWLDDAVVGTVQMDIALPPNQPHRCEVAKMIVHSRARRRGVARRLMLALEAHARSIGKTLITLDTRTGDKAESLYGSLGFRAAGVIPHYAYDPDGRARHGTTYMYKEI